MGFSGITQCTLSAVLYIVVRSFQDGGERGWQIKTAILFNLSYDCIRNCIFDWKQWLTLQ